MGGNNDRAALSNLMLLGTSRITMGSGIDQIDIREVAADPSTIITVDGGSGTDTFDLNGLASPNLTVTGFEPNEDTTDPNDVDSTVIEQAVVAKFVNCDLLPIVT